MTATASNPPVAQVRVQALDGDDRNRLPDGEAGANDNGEPVVPMVLVHQDATDGIGGLSPLDGDVVIAGLYGSLRVTRTGHWTYVPDPEDQAMAPR